MSELKIDDRLIDKIHGVVTVVDAEYPNQIKFRTSTGGIFFRTLTDVQLMKPAPPESKLKGFCKAVVIGLCMVALCTVVVILASKVVVISQAGL